MQVKLHKISLKCTKYKLFNVKPDETEWEKCSPAMYTGPSVLTVLKIQCQQLFQSQILDFMAESNLKIRL